MVDRAWGELFAVGLVYVVGLGVGLLSLVLLPVHPPPSARGEPGARRDGGGRDRSDAGSAGAPPRHDDRGWDRPAQLLRGSRDRAGGQRDEISLAVLLVVGFALHNATEGFGIVGALAGAGVQATWGWLLVAGLVAGGPTFLGTVGDGVQLRVRVRRFLALAAGAILYVIGELFASGRRLSWILTLWGCSAASSSALRPIW